jgi:beta-glucosidase
MTLDEKVDMMHGESNNFYGFYNAPIPRLGIPALTGYEQFNIQPQYPFGHGLPYTTFAYSNLRTTPTSVTVNVTNSGEVAGSEIVQVYAGKLPTPLPAAPKSLPGFAKVALQPGQSHDVTIALAPEPLSYWDVTTHAWVAPAGNIPIMVGASSADIRLNGTVQTAATTPAAPAPAATAAPATSAPLATTGRAALEVP